MNTITTSLTALFLLLTSMLFAQDGKITGSIITKDAKPFEGATIRLIRAKDSSAIKTTISGKDGLFIFEQVPDSKYFIAATAVAHNRAISKPIDINLQQRAIQLPALVLMVRDASLSDVTVSAKRPMIEQRIDRTIVNVEAVITN